MDEHPLFLNCSEQMCRIVGALAVLLLVQGLIVAAEPHPPAVLPGTEQYVSGEDLVKRSMTQWDGFLLRSIAEAQEGRERFWRRDASSAAAYELSLTPNRDHLRRIIGLVDSRVQHPRLEITASIDHPGPLAEASTYRVWAVRWPVLRGIHGEGLVLQPKEAAKATVILVPDAGQPPEEMAGLLPGGASAGQVAQRLAESGALVVIPLLVNRQSTYAGDDRLGIYTNQTHREWIYRQAAEVGRHIIGYEVQKVLSLIDGLKTPEHSGNITGRSRGPVGVVGYGEGGLIALYAAALDNRIDAAWVSGYFQPRERVWSEPLDRSIWGLLEEFGDAEIAAMIAPRALVVEASLGPEVPSVVSGPVRSGPKQSAAPGTITTPPFQEVKREWQRARALAGSTMTRRFKLVGGGGEITFGSPEARLDFGSFLGLADQKKGPEPIPSVTLPPPAWLEERQHRTVQELQDDAQALARLSEYSREKLFWSKVDPSSSKPWQDQVAEFRNDFANDVNGVLPETDAPLRPRTRLMPDYSNSRWAAYEVVLDVYPDIVTWGHLLLPTDIKPGERRPVVVCQHGAGGLPDYVVAKPADPLKQKTYQAFGASLADRGYVIFAPYNPNTLGGESFRQLQRKANLLRQSIFSIITLDHRRILRWLKQQPFVDPGRIGFYGISYGGKTAMRVPAQLEDYCLSICSGDFNEYVSKMTSVRSDKNSFLFTSAYETIEWNLANTFDYAEMAALIAPRPFMVEQGYQDRVSPLELSAGEYAKIQRLYFRLRIPDRTEIEYFDGPHMIHGHGTFEFLRRFLPPAGR